MTRPLPRRPRPAPPAHLDVSERLEDQGIAAWEQGDRLVADLLPAGPSRAVDVSTPIFPMSSRACRVFICATDARALANALADAVFTSADERRLTLGTAAGPIDLLPIGDEPIESVLPRFGLSALCFAWRARSEAYCDPTDALESLGRGVLDVAGSGDGSDEFRTAPRRYWIAARLLAEYGLEPSPRLVDAARAAWADCRGSIPEGAPARRELQRVLVANDPTAGLQFLHAVGVFGGLFPGSDPRSAQIMSRLDRDLSLRWAACLSGTATQRALRVLRMPLGRAREIERLLRVHPIEQAGAAHAAGESGVRRLRQRLHPDQIEGLLAWRAAELDASPESSDAQAARARLREIRARLAELEVERSRSERIRQLAIDGDTVMAILGRGPGKHVGLALFHLAEFVAAHPEANEVSRLESEVENWASLHPA
jgi:hypothetical protein